MTTPRHHGRGFTRVHGDHGFLIRSYFDLLLKYILGVIAVKYIYQLPCICGSPPLRFRSLETQATAGNQTTIMAYCYSQEASLARDMFIRMLPSRSDYVLGLHYIDIDMSA